MKTKDNGKASIKPPVAPTSSKPAATHHHPTNEAGLRSRKASILTVVSASEEHKHFEIVRNIVRILYLLF